VNTFDVWSSGCKLDKKCPHLKAAKKHTYSQHILQHLQCKSHSTPSCHDGADCDAYKRLVKGGHCLDDLCHLQMYRHPPRLNHGSNAYWQQWSQYAATSCVHEHAGIAHYRYHAHTLKTSKGALMREVKANGCQYVLTPHMAQIVNEKLNHCRHKRFGSPLTYDEMLALILYANTAMCAEIAKAETDANYDRWQHFRVNLASAVYKLPSVSDHAMLYYGLCQATPCAERDCNGWWQARTVWSATMDRQVALRSIEAGGCLLEIPIMDDEYGTMFDSVDMAWISSFPDEKEVLLLPNKKFRIQYVGTADIENTVGKAKKIQVFKLKV